MSVPEEVVEALQTAAGGPVVVLSLVSDLTMDALEFQVRELGEEELHRLAGAGRSIVGAVKREFLRRAGEQTPVYPEVATEEAKEGVRKHYVSPRPWSGRKEGR